MIERRKVNMIENNCLWTMVCVTRTARISNEIIFRRIGEKREVA